MSLRDAYVPALRRDLHTHPTRPRIKSGARKVAL